MRDKIMQVQKISLASGNLQELNAFLARNDVQKTEHIMIGEKPFVLVYFYVYPGPVLKDSQKLEG